MKRFRSRYVVEAVQWFPGELTDRVITDPKDLVGKPGAHMGHQRGLGEAPGNGVIYARGDWHFVHPGDWLLHEGHELSIMRDEDFRARFEPMPEGA